MGGNPTQIDLEDLLGLDLSQWRVAISTPALKVSNQGRELRNLALQDGQGLLLATTV